MSYREDFFRMLDGKTPVSDVAYYKFMVRPGDPPSGVVGISADYANFAQMMETGKNAWGIEHSFDFLNTGPMPTPGKFLLTDITKWKDVIKAPYRYDYDFKAAAEADLAAQTWDKETQLSSMFGLGGDLFLRLVSFMGFEGALMAMLDQPEAVAEVLDYFCDYDAWVVDNVLSYYPVDIVGFGDDNATDINPFFSYKVFTELFLPRYKRLFAVAKEHGAIISYHNCGRCEDFMDDMVAIGTQIWNCATLKNDVKAFKERHDNKIIVEVIPRMYPDDTEENIRKLVRETIDELAPGGAFVWIGDAAVNMDSAQGQQVHDWVYDEVAKYGKGYYL